MPRFTPATEAALIKAGWFEGRVVPDEEMKDWLVINWCPHYLPQGYTKISPKAWQALNEFGGLSIARGNDATLHLLLNPWRVMDKVNPSWRSDTMGWQLGTDLFPIGTMGVSRSESSTHGSERAVYMGNDGRVFIQEHPLFCLGHTIEEALERVVAGERGEPIRASESAQTQSINDTIRELISRREEQLMQGQWPDEATTFKADKKNAYAGLLAITDWDAEAKRVCRAFGITQPCVFSGPIKGKSLRPDSDRFGLNKEKVALGDGLFLGVNYSLSKRFSIFDSSDKLVRDVGIKWDGHCSITSIRRKGFDYPPALLKGLFNLGLLTPEVEEELKISITQHEKLEWQLEFEKWEESE